MLRSRNHHPEQIRHRLIARPFEVAIALMFLVTTASLAVQQVVSGSPVVGPLVLPNVLVWTWIAAISTGAIGMLVGCLSGISSYIGRAAERAGLWLAGAGWLTLSLTAIIYEPGSLLTYLQGFIVTGAIVLRILGMTRVEKVIRHVADDGEEEEARSGH